MWGYPMKTSMKKTKINMGEVKLIVREINSNAEKIKR